VHLVGFTIGKKKLSNKSTNYSSRNDTDWTCTLRNLVRYLTTLSATYTSRILR